MKKFVLCLLVLTNVQMILCQFTGTRGNECPNECQCDLLNDLIDCSGRNFTELPTHINSEVKTLDLSYNSFDAVPSGLQKYETLTNLYLHHNNIDHVDVDSFKIPTLEELDLTHNKIISWRNINPNKVIQLAISLRKLRLGFNDIRIINDDGFNSSSLQVLSLENCSLKNISSSFLHNLYSIKTLTLANNHLRQLVLDSLTLQSLNLTHNHIEDVPANALAQLPQLKELILSKNRIRTFYRVYSTSLEKLEMAFCNLEFGTFGHLPNLRIIVLKGNYIRKVGNKFFSNGLLEYIDLSNNAINTIDALAFVNLKNVVYIDLSTNQISQINSRLFLNNTNLKILNLSRNYLMTINFQSPSLILLDMSYCEIQTIPEKKLNMFPSLQRLELSRNLISALPTTINIPSLEYIDVSMNKLSDITNNTFSSLSKLKILNLAGNRFTSGMKAGYFPKTVDTIVLDDNLWICNCYSSDFRQFYDYLTKPPAKVDYIRLMCHSPENVTGRTWHLACSYAWYQEKGGRKEKMWLYAVSMVLGLSIIFFAVLSVKKVYERKQIREQRERERIAEEARERIRRMRVSHRENAQQNAPDPRELQRPPSYAEAVLMARVDGSTTSLAGSRVNVSSSRTDVSKTKPNSAGASKPKKRKTKRTQSESTTASDGIVSRGRDIEPNQTEIETLTNNCPEHHAEHCQSATEDEPTTSTSLTNSQVTESNL